MPILFTSLPTLERFLEPRLKIREVRNVLQYWRRKAAQILADPNRRGLRRHQNTVVKIRRQAELGFAR